MSDLLDLYPYLGGLVLSTQRPLSNRAASMRERPNNDDLAPDSSMPRESENNIVDITQNFDLDQKSQTSPDEGFSRKDTKRGNANIKSSNVVPEQDTQTKSNTELETRAFSKHVTQSKNNVKQTRLGSSVLNTNESKKNGLPHDPKNAPTQNNSKSGQSAETKETQQISAKINKVDHRLTGSTSPTLDEEPVSPTIGKPQNMAKISATHVSDFKDKMRKIPSEDKPIKQTISQKVDTNKVTIDKTKRDLRHRTTSVAAHQHTHFQSDNLTSPVNAKQVVSQERGDSVFELEKQKPRNIEGLATPRPEAISRQTSDVRQSTKKKTGVSSTLLKPQRIPSLYAGHSTVTNLVDKATTPTKNHIAKNINTRQDINAQQDIIARASRSIQKSNKISPLHIQTPTSRPQKRQRAADKTKSAKLQIGQVNLVVRSKSTTPPPSDQNPVVIKPSKKSITPRPMPVENRRYRKRF